MTTGVTPAAARANWRNGTAAEQQAGAHARRCSCTSAPSRCWRGWRSASQRLPAFCVPRPGGGIAGIVLPVLALLSGCWPTASAIRTGSTCCRRPLLLILLWNLLVYLMLAAAVRRCCACAVRRPLRRAWHWPALPRARARKPWLAAALARFSDEWLSLSAPLSRARGARSLHLCGRAAGPGAALSLYLRGMLAQYQVGWESTFLDAAQVHALLSWLFPPAMSLLRPARFHRCSRCEALRFGQPAPAGSGAHGCTCMPPPCCCWWCCRAWCWPRWPGGASAAWPRRFPLDLAQPYFQRLLRRPRAGAAAMPAGLPLQLRGSTKRARPGLAGVARMAAGRAGRS